MGRVNLRGRGSGRSRSRTPAFLPCTGDKESLHQTRKDTGCVSYAQIELADVADYEEVRVTLTDGERQQLLEPQVDADSIRGQLEQGGRHIGAFAALLFFAVYLAIVNDPNY